MVHAEHDYVLSGRADFAIGYGATEHGTSPAMDSYLTVVEVQHAGTFVAAWAQMMAYVGMVHRSRVARGKKSVTVYGICSDGIRYLFARVDNKGLVNSPALPSVRLIVCTKLTRHHLVVEE